jgi:hypothetical protein
MYWRCGVSWIIQKLAGFLASSATGSLIVIVISAAAFLFGHMVGEDGAEIAFAAERLQWAEERIDAHVSALDESEARREKEREFADRLSIAAKELINAKDKLATLRARADRADGQLRDTRIALAAALDSAKPPAAAACLHAADLTLGTLGECTETYRDVADQYGQCLAGLQMTAALYEAARGLLSPSPDKGRAGEGR